MLEMLFRLFIAFTFLDDKRYKVFEVALEKSS